MSKIEDGDIQAFAHPAYPNIYGKGMTLRQWYAGQALPGLITLCQDDTLADGATYPEHVAARAYAMADAMLAAREPKP